MRPHRTDPYVVLANTAKVSRMLGGFLLVVGLLIGLLMGLIWVLGGDQTMVSLVGIVLTVCYIVPGILLYLLSGKIEEASHGAVVGTIIVAAITILIFGGDMLFMLLGNRPFHPLNLLLTAMPLLLSLALLYHGIKAMRVLK